MGEGSSLTGRQRISEQLPRTSAPNSRAPEIAILARSNDLRRSENFEFGDCLFLITRIPF
jgi:hypothetical protein